MIINYIQFKEWWIKLIKMNDVWKAAYKNYIDKDIYKNINHAITNNKNTLISLSNQA